ncbi:hypothetical protein AB0M61_01480 [Streptomyces sp. NPDC051642]|uniref:hypothetical protein n=1 Tax=Streptomyces sp. NPDC051642 TaxID=3154646 RepID=UPI0034191F76
MNGPEHLREGKRLLAHCGNWDKGSSESQSLATEATAHLLVALTAVLVADRLEERTSWKEAAEA